MGNLIHLNFFIFNQNLNFLEEDQFNFGNPLDYELNSLKIFFSQKNFFFFKMRIIIAFIKMHYFDLNYFFTFIDYPMNEKLINCHLNECHYYHLGFIDFLEDFYLLVEFHQYLLQYREDYYSNYFAFEDSNSIFD